MQDMSLTLIRFFKMSILAPILVLGLPAWGAQNQANVNTATFEREQAPSGFSRLRSLEARGAKASGLVMRLRDGKVLASLHDGQRLTPASVSKLILAAAALEKWGSDHTFVTKFHVMGPRKNGVLSGDLILEGAGDPYLTNEKLWFLATDVARMGVRQVEGNLVLNTSLFGTIEPDSNRLAGARNSTHAYDSPLSAAAVNFSVLAVVAGPGAAPGLPGPLALEPYPLDTVSLSGFVSTVASGRAKVSVSRHSSGNGQDRLAAAGQIPMGSLPVRVYRSVSDANAYTGAVLRAFLAKAGVVVKGGVKVERTPVTRAARPLASVESFPLDWQIRGLFKVSNNFIGDMLTIGLDVDDSQSRGATLSGGASKLETYMQRTLLEAPGFLGKSEGTLVLESGSGLTPENRLSAKDVVAVLARMYNNAREFPSFLAALPIPGSEGTVKKRFAAPEALHLKDRLRAKTGTLTEPRDAVALGGYSRLKDGDWVAFAVLVNGTERNPSLGVEGVRELIDQELAGILPPEM